MNKFPLSASSYTFQNKILVRLGTVEWDFIAVIREFFVPYSLLIIMGGVMSILKLYRLSILYFIYS